MIDHLKAWARSAGVWFNAALLSALPFTEQIVQGVHDYLPSFAPYLPTNVYQTVGCLVVTFNMVRSMQRAHKAARAKEAANG